MAEMRSCTWLDLWMALDGGDCDRYMESLIEGSIRPVPIQFNPLNPKLYDPVRNFLTTPRSRDLHLLLKAIDDADCA